MSVRARFVIDEQNITQGLQGFLETRPVTLDVAAMVTHLTARLRDRLHTRVDLVAAGDAVTVCTGVLPGVGGWLYDTRARFWKESLPGRAAVRELPLFQTNSDRYDCVREGRGCALRKSKDRVYKQEAVDVEVAVRALEASLRRDCDVLVVVTADRDLRPALDAAAGHLRGKAELFTSGFTPAWHHDHWLPLRAEEAGAWDATDRLPAHERAYRSLADFFVHPEKIRDELVRQLLDVAPAAAVACRTVLALTYFEGLFWSGYEVESDALELLLDGWPAVIDAMPQSSRPPARRLYDDVRRLHHTYPREIAGAPEWREAAGLLSACRGAVRGREPLARNVRAIIDVFRANAAWFGCHGQAFSGGALRDAIGLLLDAEHEFDALGLPWHAAWSALRRGEFLLDAACLCEGPAGGFMERAEDAVRVATARMADVRGGVEDHELLAGAAMLVGDLRFAEGDAQAAFASYRDAVVRAYSVHLWPGPPVEYTRRFYNRVVGAEPPLDLRGSGRPASVTDRLLTLVHDGRLEAAVAAAEQLAGVWAPEWGSATRAGALVAGAASGGTDLRDALIAVLFPPGPTPADIRDPAAFTAELDRRLAAANANVYHTA